MTTGAPVDDSVTGKGWRKRVTPRLPWLAAALLLAVAIVVILWFVEPERTEWAFQKHGNAASVLGLLLGLSALIFTIWQVLETQTIEEVARKREREAMERANREICEAREAILAAEKRAHERVRAIAGRDLQSLCEQAEHRLRLGESALYEKERLTQNKWKNALEALTAARGPCLEVVHFVEVTTEERSDINLQLRELDSVIRVLGRKKQEAEHAAAQKRKRTPKPEEATPEPKMPDIVGLPEPGREDNEREPTDDLTAPIQALLRLMISIRSRINQALYR